MNKANSNKSKDLHIPIPEDLYQLLADVAQKHGTSPEEFAQKTLSDYIFEATESETSSLPSHEKPVSG